MDDLKKGTLGMMAIGTAGVIGIMFSYSVMNSRLTEQSNRFIQKSDSIFSAGMKAGGKKVRDSIAKSNAFSLPIPSQIRNQASTAKLPAASAKQAISK